MSSHAEPSTRLSRRLGPIDAVVIGLGSMLGAGVFAAFGPAARAAGNGLLVGLALAGLVAFCNATSSAALAALYPESGGAYVYGRKRLGDFWGFAAGFAFVIGKLASCSAMAMTFASYTAPEYAHPVAIAVVAALTAVNYVGIQKTALLTRAVVALVLAALVAAVAAVWFGGATNSARLWPLDDDATPYGVLQSSAFLFFAFAGYARIATLGEEVADPERTIPRAIPIALAIVLLVYAAVGTSAVAGAGAEALAASDAPLVTAVEAGRLAFVSPVVRAGAAVASLGVLLSLIAGVSRTAFAMASQGDLPRFFSAVHPRYRVPHRAELATGVLVAGLTAVTDVRSAIGLSSFAVLLYYAVANASAWTLRAGERRSPRGLAALGLAGCLLLAATLPLGTVAAASGLLAAGALLHLARRR
jgi:APA family basic amino acid/polyamine antiporter